MRRLVYVLGLIAVAVCALALASPAKADAIDPAIGVKGCTSTCSDPWTGTFTFTIDTEHGATCEGGICDFTSGGFFITEGTITNFLFDFGTPQEGGFSPAEKGQTVTPISASAALLTGFTIVPGSECGFDCITLLSFSTLDVVSGTIASPFQFDIFGATEGSVVQVTSNVSPVPEPGTMVLLGTGLGALVLKRLRRKARA